MGKGFVLFIVVATIAVFSLSWCADRKAAPGAAAEDSQLQITAARSPIGIQFTNREAVALRTCALTLRDSTNTAWSALMPDEVPVNGTLSVSWSQFHSNGQPMPGYVGLDEGVTVHCALVGSGLEKSAGIGK